MQEPSSQIFVKLGLLSSGDLRWEFWERAGLSREHLFAAPDGSSSEAAHPMAHPVVGVPLLDVQLGASLVNDFVTGAKPIEMLSAPADWCPNPQQTFCAFVEGDSMEPRIRDGSIACFDTADHSPAALVDKIVVAQHPRLGTKLAWLLRHGDRMVFRSEDPKVPLTMLDEQWRIVGRLLWWLSRA